MNEVNETILTLLIATTIVTDKIRKVDICLSILAFLLCLVHFSILVRKELRSNAIFILILGICSSDIIRNITSILSDFKQIKDYQRINYCFGYDSFAMTSLELFRDFFHRVATSIASWLTITLAFFRTLLILYPMSSIAHQLAETTSTAKTIIYYTIFFTIFANFWGEIGRYAHHLKTDSDLCLLPVRLERWDNLTMEEVQYTKEERASNYLFYSTARGLRFISVFKPISHFLLSISLIMAIRKAAKRIQNTRSSLSEKSIKSTTKLILTMSILFFISDFFASLEDYLDEFVPYNEQNRIITFKLMFSDFFHVLSAINSIPQFFLCYFLSSQYQEVVKRVLRIKKKDMSISNEVSSHRNVEASTGFTPTNHNSY
ncbi:hypothetical protein GCK72_021145 [Caenorhabditis remanei]|uniref:G-protein coupled receptors family 1 profile domain-containing protein n=1 Tax=Caenorhabditis remanei TaxID=31234 RepID=A0A6A5GJA0_CAERE|nr:hypothetical protein GCK72_021145 [Caenorhabditis remanei]KAF1754582.1 hypothetical protein GCK72_021145 [Caenorhabditis remanei]